jgi:hypothetical protein
MSASQRPGGASDSDLEGGSLEPGRRLVLVAALVVFLSAGAILAGGKTDRVLLSNGDYLTGEIKRLERGSLKFDTTATGTIKIRQDLVLKLTSPRRFEVETQSGLRFYGPLDDPKSEGMLRVATESKVHDFDLDEIVRIQPIESKFLKRIDGHVSLGFNATGSTDVSQISFNGDAVYKAERYNVFLDVSSIRTEQESGMTSRYDVTAGSERRVGRKWFTLATGSLQHNEDLGIDLRVLLGGGFGRYVIQTVHNEFSVAAGAAVSREDFEGDEPSEDRWEGIVAAQYSIFKNLPRDITLTANLKLFPGITESSRFRTELDIEYRHEIVSDLTIGLTLYSSTDSDPPPDSDNSDYGITSSVGWSF